MISFVTGSIFDTDWLPAHGRVVLVCPVNCVGVMGAGLAKEFAKRFVVEREYKALCKSGRLRPGHPTLDSYQRKDIGRWQSVCCLPTKDHWRNPSRLDWIEAGLSELGRFLDAYGRPWTVALPALGCGLGGLDWTDVRPLIVRFAEGLAEHEFRVYGEGP